MSGKKEHKIKCPFCKEQFHIWKNRPLLGEEDLKKIDCPYPPEPEGDYELVKEKNVKYNTEPVEVECSRLERIDDIASDLGESRQGVTHRAVDLYLKVVDAIEKIENGNSKLGIPINIEEAVEVALLENYRIEKSERAIISLLIQERERQTEKWGEQNHDPAYWMGVLMEEVGEVAKAMIENNTREYRKELIEVAAVAVQMVACLDRNKHNLPGLMQKISNFGEKRDA